MHDQVTIHSEVDIRDLIAAGDPVAFQRLYNENRDNMYKAAYSVLRCREDTLEALQEIFLKAWNIRAEFTKVKSLEDYLYIMARNKAVSLLLKRKREIHFLLTETWETRVSPSPQILIEHSESEAVYNNMLQRLTERQRIVFTMSREDNMSHEQIAQRLAISPNTVNNHIKAALTTIRSILAAEAS